MEGKLLKQAIDLSDYKIDEVISITGISRGGLYSLFDKEEIKEEYKKRIEKLKLNINWNTKSTNNQNSIEIFQLEIEHLKDKIAMLEQENIFLKSLLQPKVELKGKMEKQHK